MLPNLEKKGGMEIVFLAILAVWLVLAIPFFILHHFAADYIGSLGDSFGIVNSAVSSLAFAGLYYTIVLQKKELAETRAEFRQQNETFKRQRFENTFFNLLTLHQTTIASFEYQRGYNQNIQKGRKVLVEIYC